MHKTSTQTPIHDNYFGDLRRRFLSGLLLPSALAFSALATTGCGEDSKGGRVADKINAAWASINSWTPENIQKDKVGYIKHVQQKLNEALELFGAREIEIRESITTYSRLKEEQAAKQKKSLALIQQFAQKYKQADADNAWPIVIASGDSKVTLTKPELSAHLKKWNSQETKAGEKVKKLTEKIASATAQLAKIKIEREALKEKIEDMKLEVAQFKADLTTGDASSLKDSVKALTDSASSIFSATSGDTKDVLTEALIEETGKTTQADAALEQILKNNP
ncbi:MAG: hypothetical protein LBT53_02830 [Puniceicoccales bacterium]|jgi:uncharacterized coiled-coil DUF342 family protein|nr:hypothetical protein [Puniceicoccales bacterium]